MGVVVVRLLHVGKDCHSVNLPTLCPHTHVSMDRRIKKYCRGKCWGVGNGCNNPPPPPRPERVGVAAKTNNFLSLIFLFCSLVTIMAMFLNYLRYLVGCFTF